MAKKPNTSEPTTEESIRFQLLFKPESEPDVCAFLRQIRPTDRRATCLHALRMLMQRTGFYESRWLSQRFGSTEPTGRHQPERPPDQPGLTTALDGHGHNSEDLTDDQLADMEDIVSMFPGV